MGNFNMDHGPNPQSATQGNVVTILLAVYNGAQHLPDQLASIAAQTHIDWQMMASDDGSSDGSSAILEGFAEQHPLQYIKGPQCGFNSNFMHLFSVLPEHSGMVALCDQDDVWLPGKLEAAVAVLAGLPDDVPALYCCRRLIWDGSDTQHPSLLYSRPPSFANALIENVAPGNTIVLNSAAAALVRSQSAAAENVYAYDWWMYQLITGVGGHIHYDPEPWVLYRQHGRNLVGAGETVLGFLSNKLAVLRGVYTTRITQHLTALQASDAVLTPQSRAQLGQFIAARSVHVIKRLGAMRRAGVYRQSFLSDLQFRVAVCLGRV